METPRQLDEHISALMDGELSGPEAGLAAAALAEPEGGLAWRAYHLIGDVLRSDASGAELGEGFSSRLAARLNVEVPPAVGHAVPGGVAQPAPAPDTAPGPAPGPAAAPAPAPAPAPSAAQLPAATAPALTAAITPGR